MLELQETKIILAKRMGMINFLFMFLKFGELLKVNIKKTLIYVIRGFNRFLNKKASQNEKLFCCLVRAGRLELPHLAALDPKSSVSTNSTTPAKHP